ALAPATPSPCNSRRSRKSAVPTPATFLFLLPRPPPPRPTLFPYTTLFRSWTAYCQRRTIRRPLAATVGGSQAMSPASRRESRSRSEEHTSELQSRGHLVCRLLLEKKKRRRPRAAQRDGPTEERSRQGQPRG